MIKTEKINKVVMKKRGSIITQAWHLCRFVCPSSGVGGKDFDGGGVVRVSYDMHSFLSHIHN